MRVPGWAVGFAVVGWIGLTAACSVTAFVSARYLQINNGVNGVPLPRLELGNIRPTPTVIIPTSVAQESTPIPEATSAVEVAALPATPTTAPQVVDEEPAVVDDNGLVRSAVTRLGPRKITLLLLGIDQRSAVESADTEYFRTDTMIVLQIDPIRRTAGMLSIPRDLYVPIPGFTESRINTANYLGDSNAYPGGGPALAMETIKENLGLEVDHYVLVNFDVFTTVVDTVAPNGVEVCVQEPIYDPKYPDEGYGFMEVRFDTGCQRLDSERLLQYARTRATQGSDFDRARRQQQVITAIQREVISAGGLANLVLKAPTLWAELAGNLRTDLSFDEAVDIALLATTVDRENIQTGVIDNLYVTFDKDETGADILVPIPASISALIQDTFHTQGDLTTDDLRARAEQEGASVIVLNNTDTRGLATTTRDWLTANGVGVTTVGNAQTITGADTVIRDYTGNPWTARYIAAVMGLSRDRILAGTDGQTSEDIAIFVGPDINTIMGQ